MNYDNLINDNGIYLYKDDSFQTIYTQFDFLVDKGNKKDAIHAILCDYLMKSNKKYKSVDAINKRKRELYSLNIGFSTSYVGSKKFLYFYSDIVSPKVIKDDYLESVFEFMKDILFYSDFTNEEVFYIVKKNYLSNLKYSLSDSENFAKRLYNETVYKKEDEKFRFSTDINFLFDIINSITLSDLENEYKNIICKNSFYRGLVFGNITDKEYEKFKEYFKFNSNINGIDFTNYKDIEEQTIEISNEEMNETIAYVTYKIDIPNRELSILLFEILNNSWGLCMQILREKYGLCYESYSIINRFDKILYFLAKIDKNNIKKLLEAIDEIVMTLQDKKELKQLLSLTKEQIKHDYYILGEDRDKLADMLDNHICGVYGNFNENEFATKVDSYTEEDIINCIRSLKRKNVFIYRGDKNE